MRPLHQHSDEHVALLLRLGIAAARSRRLQEADCEDCSVEFVVHMLEPQRWNSWLGTRCSPSWATRCATNFAADFHAKMRSYERRSTAVTVNAPVETGRDASDERTESVVFRSSLKSELKRAVTSISCRRHQAIRLRYYDGKTTLEKARILCGAPDAIRMAIKRCLLDVRRHLLDDRFDADEALQLVHCTSG